MNVLILSQFFWPENFRINELAEELSKSNKINVHVLTCQPSYPHKKFFKKKIKKFKNLNITRVPVYLRNGSMLSKILNYITFIVCATYYLLLQNKIKYKKIFVFQVSPVFSAIPAIIYSKFNDCKIYVWVLDIWPESINVFGFNSKILFKLIKKISDFIYSRADLLFAQSISIKKILEKRYKKKTIYLPNWNEYIPYVKINKKLDLELKKNIKKNKINIFFGGNIGKAQDVKNILKVIKLTHQKTDIFNWYFFGEGTEKNEIIKFIADNKYFKNVFLFKNTSQPIFFSIIKKYADLLLVSLTKSKISKWTIPGKIQFYFQSKKPIIGMLDGESNFLIKQSHSGFVVNSGNYLQFYRMLVYLLKINRNLIFKKKGINGYNYSKKFFKKKRIIDKLKSYLEVI